MLKNIDPILSPELLATMRAMGHGDEIAIVDGNYPALEHGRRVVRLDGVHIVPTIHAVLSVLPIDDFVDDAIFRSTKGNEKSALEPVHREIEAAINAHAPNRDINVLIGDAFYERVKAAHVIVATSEPRLYANVIFRKGVIYPS